VARSNDRDRGTRRAPKDLGRRGARKKVCIFCKDHLDWVDYKDVNLLRRFMSDRGKIRARRVTGNCAQHQRDVAVAIKTARELALLPYTQRTVTERAGRREGGRGRGPRGGESPLLVGAARPEPEAAAEADVTEPEADLVGADLVARSGSAGEAEVDEADAGP
jgi:small subunit ribosomal protein S18